MPNQAHSDLDAGDLDGQDCPAAYADADLQALALEAGLPNSTWSFSPELRAFAELIAERCACIGDKYPDADGDGRAGDEIRAAFGLG